MASNIFLHQSLKINLGLFLGTLHRIHVKNEMYIIFGVLNSIVNNIIILNTTRNEQIDSEKEKQF